MTDDEYKWFLSLQRVLNKMPDTVEIQVHNSGIQMNRKGARDAEFERIGHADVVESLCEFSTIKIRIYPCGESV